MNSETIILLRQRCHFDEAKVHQYQEVADNLYDLWYKLTSDEGTGNCFHAISVGHVANQLFLHGSLYRYSQQGWELVNKQEKRSFYWQTNMG